MARTGAVKAHLSIRQAYLAAMVWSTMAQGMERAREIRRYGYTQIQRYRDTEIWRVQLDGHTQLGWPLHSLTRRWIKAARRYLDMSKIYDTFV